MDREGKQRMTGIVVVGYGLVGRRHAKIVHEKRDFELLGVVDLAEVYREEVEGFGSRFYGDLATMFSDVDPEGLILATPTRLHKEQGLECIERGCSLLIEKPLALGVEDARELVDRARVRGVSLLVGHHRRYSGVMKKAREIVESGELGEIRAVQASCWFYKPDSYFAKAPWRQKQGAGPISVNLIHDVDLLRCLCGDVESVYGVARVSRRGFENEDVASAILTFSSGAVATVSVSDSVVSPWSWEMTSGENPAYAKTQESCYLIGGEKGSLSLPDLRLWRHEGENDWWKPIGATSLTRCHEDPFESQLDHFSRVLRKEEQPFVSGEEGMRSLEVIEALARSAMTGERVMLGR